MTQAQALMLAVKNQWRVTRHRDDIDGWEWIVSYGTEQVASYDLTEAIEAFAQKKKVT